ncbi:MAG: YajQ family cyclic di-GMP-binding protein [Calditrichaeota bacterium]|nr:YajQ family cyclic di-GMP-binding protein [Calditrichota bacterium]
MPSFDIVSKVDMMEVKNAINQAMHEIRNRFDFKKSKSDISLGDDEITLISDDEYKLKNVIDILETRLVKRNVPLKALDYGKIEEASGGTVRQVVKIKQGISKEDAKKINKLIKDMRLKVQSQVMEDHVRVTGKKRDDLQQVIQMLKEKNLDFPVQFINFRN